MPLLHLEPRGGGHVRTLHGTALLQIPLDIPRREQHLARVRVRVRVRIRVRVRVRVRVN